MKKKFEIEWDENKYNIGKVNAKRVKEAFMCWFSDQDYCPDPRFKVTELPEQKPKKKLEKFEGEGGYPKRDIIVKINELIDRVNEL